MGLQWQMRTELLIEDELINEALAANWEPFTVRSGQVFFKRQAFVEDDEPKSSTRPENANRAGNEPDLRDELEGA